MLCGALAAGAVYPAVTHVTAAFCVWGVLSSLVDTSLVCMKFLRILDVSNNAISDLDATLDALHANSFLNHLELRGNPVAEEANYRLRVIAAMPSLTILDSHKVTDTEREAAKARSVSVSVARWP